MGGIRTGEIVDITIKGVRVVSHPSGRYVRIVDEHGNTYEMPHQAAITRAKPEDWPPRPGDVWRDDHGGLWFAQEWPSGIRMVRARVGGTPPDDPKTPDALLAEGPLFRAFDSFGEPPF
jgi:hypothetical protein